MLEIKLVSYNLDHSSKKQQISQNIADLAAKGVQVFCFQEVRARSNEEFIGDYILKNLGADWQGKFFISLDSKNDLGLGMIWNTKFLQPLDFEELYLPKLSKLEFWESLLEWGFLSGSAEVVKRGALLGNFKSGNDIFRISNIHLDWQGSFLQRFSQLQFLYSHLNQNPQTHEIIAGDFNTLGFFANSVQIKKIQELFGPEFLNVFPIFKVTTTHHQQLDQIFVKNFERNDSEVYSLPGSDHFPIMASVSGKPAKSAV